MSNIVILLVSIFLTFCSAQIIVPYHFDSLEYVHELNETQTNIFPGKYHLKATLIPVKLTQTKESDINFFNTEQNTSFLAGLLKKTPYCKIISHDSAFHAKINTNGEIADCIFTNDENIISQYQVNILKLNNLGATKEYKSFLYLLKRELGMSSSEKWQVSSSNKAGISLIQRRFFTPLIHKTMILRMMMPASEPFESILLGLGGNSKRIFIKHEIMSSQFTKIKSGNSTIYELPLNDYFNKDVTHLNELQIFYKKTPEQLLQENILEKLEVVALPDHIKILPISVEGTYTFLDFSFLPPESIIEHLSPLGFPWKKIRGFFFTYSKTDMPIVMGSTSKVLCGQEYAIGINEKLYWSKTSTSPKALGENNITLNFGTAELNSTVNITPFPGVFYTFDKIILEPIDVNISKKDLITLMQQSNIEIASTQKSIPMSVKLLLVFMLGYLLFQTLKFFPLYLRYIRLRIESDIASIVTKNPYNKFSLSLWIFILYSFIALVFYASSEEFYISIGGIIFVISLYYLSSAYYPYIEKKFPHFAAIIYKSPGLRYFVFAIMFLFCTAFFVLLKFQELAEQSAIIVFYCLAWGTVKEIMKDKNTK